MMPTPTTTRKHITLTLRTERRTHVDMDKLALALLRQAREQSGKQPGQERRHG